MFAREAGAAIALHETGRAVTIHVSGSAHADVAGALLHNDAEDDTLINAELCALLYRIPDAADVLASVAGLEHLGLVEVEDSLKRLPLVHGGEFGRRTGIVLETHRE